MLGGGARSKHQAARAVDGGGRGRADSDCYLCDRRDAGGHRNGDPPAADQHPHSYRHAVADRHANSVANTYRHRAADFYTFSVAVTYWDAAGH